MNEEMIRITEEKSILTFVHYLSQQRLQLSFRLLKFWTNFPSYRLNFKCVSHLKYNGFRESNFATMYQQFAHNKPFQVDPDDGPGSF
jgi:hypothetical protein